MSDIKIGRLVIGIAQTNCYFIYKEGSGECVFVDPADQGATIYEKLKANGLSVSGIVLTHAHFDHIWGAQELRAKTGAKIYAWEEEEDLCSDSILNESDWAGRACTIKPNVYLKDGDEIEIAGIKLKLIGTPGHTKGSCCYYIEEAGILISGDTLFAESVGRTDFHTGSMSTLVRSIKEKLLVLPEDTRVYPGHGPSTTIGYEKENNPFIQ